MDATQALRELMELSSQITAAVVLDAEGTVLAGAPDDSAASTMLAATTLELVSTAADLGADGRDVTRVDREGGRTIGAVTGPKPTSGLVVYDLRTCVQAIETAEPKKRRAARKPKEPSE